MFLVSVTRAPTSARNTCGCGCYLISCIVPEAGDGAADGTGADDVGVATTENEECTAAERGDLIGVTAAVEMKPSVAGMIRMPFFITVLIYSSYRSS